MNYRDEQRLEDILTAIAAIESHVSGREVTDDLVYDAVRMRLLEIGEATKALPADLRARCPEIPWKKIAGTRDHLAHKYFATDRGEVRATVARDLGPLQLAVRELLDDLPVDD